MRCILSHSSIINAVLIGFFNESKDNSPSIDTGFIGGDVSIYLGVSNDSKSYYFTGNIAEVRFWDRVLKDDEIDYLSLGYSKLLDNSLNDQSHIVPVSNKPGWHYYYNQSECFLVVPQDPSIYQLSEKTEVSVDDHGVNTLAVNHFTASSSFSERFEFIRISTSVICDISKQLLAGGVDMLLALKNQHTPELDFCRLEPNDLYVTPPSSTLIDFDGFYGNYFWEIFYHLPTLIYSSLNENQKFEEAQKWAHYVFNPTSPNDTNLDGSEDSEKKQYWHFRPFREFSIEDIDRCLLRKKQISAYKNDPFSPDAIAQLRIGSYEKNTVMQYIDNLLDWGDQLFTLDTWESINEATLLYVLAKNLLGSRPEMQVSRNDRVTKTFTGLLEYKNQHCDCLEQLENGAIIKDSLVRLEDLPFDNTSRYFCIPENKEFIAYWDRVDNRLFNIRHCMNIDGIERSLSLWESPLDINSLLGSDGVNQLSSLSANIGHYRFVSVLQRAKSITSTVMQLGNALLSALEKQDAEELSLLQITQQGMILDMTTGIKEDQIENAKETVKSLAQGLASAEYRKEQYIELKDSGWLTAEEAQIALMYSSLASNVLAGTMATLSSPVKLVPNIFGLANGGHDVGASLNAVGIAARATAGALSESASICSTTANYQRREQDWDLQLGLAEYDVEQINAQIAGAELQQTIAEKDLEVHQESIKHNKEIEEYLRSKFTNKELYQWMLSRISSIYFQTYNLAMEYANQAQASYQFELNTTDTLIESAHWDSLKQGLLSGESLMLSLDRLEKAYTDKNTRRLEIEKTVSLATEFPNQFIQLREDGTCQFELTEQLFDYDFPGHYSRQIKSISITIPAIIGPYQNIHATLTQNTSRVVLEPDINTVKFLLSKAGANPSGSKLRNHWRPNQQVAISNGVNDSGLFN